MTNDISEKIKILRNIASENDDNKNEKYLEIDSIKFLPFRLTTLNIFIDLLEKYRNSYDNFLLKIFIVTEKIKLSLKKNKNIHHETLIQFLNDIENYEYNIVTMDLKKARDILTKINYKIYFCKYKIVTNFSTSLLKDELRKK